jgi:hypothetical protein
MEAKRRARTRAARRACGGGFASREPGTDFQEGGAGGVGELIARAGWGKEVVMGAHQAGKGVGGQREGTQEIDGLAIGLGLAQGEDAPYGLADDGDLGLEVEAKGVPFGRRERGTGGSVEAMLEGVLVTRLTTAATVGGWRGSHETSIAHLFTKCKRVFGRMSTWGAFAGRLKSQQERSQSQRAPAGFQPMQAG